MLKTDLQKLQNMDPAKKKNFLIKGLKLAGFKSIRQFALEINRSETSVWRIIKSQGRSYYIEHKIAYYIGLQADFLWKYNYNPKTNYNINNKSINRE